MPDPLEIQFSCKAIFSNGLGGNWYTQTLPNASTKLLGQEIPRANQTYISHTIFIAISSFLNPVSGSDPGPAGPARAQAQLGPGRARICPAGIFPTSAFFAEVGNCPRRSRGGRESAPGGRESTVWGAGRANPSRAGISPTSANSQRSGKSLPSLNLPDLPMALLSQGSGIKPNFKGTSSYSGFSFPY